MKITDYSRFYSKEALNSTDAILRQIGQLGLRAGKDAVNLGGGMPNVNTFPFKEATFTTSDGTQIHIDETKMKVGLQYGFTFGYDGLLDHLYKLTTRIHGVTDWTKNQIMVTVGSQHALSLANDMLMNVNDYLIIPEPVYSTALNIFEAQQPRYLIIPSDHNGMIPDELRKTLSKWDPQTCRNQYEDVPKVMYLNPIGNNPHGSTMSTERKKEIYDIASEYNILILEDDPYFFLSYAEEDIPTSFLKMDVDGRVLRLDSFSKLVSGGLRLGYMIGHKTLVNRISRKQVKSVIHVPIICQMALSGLLDEWGHEHFLQHAKKVRQFYMTQRDYLMDSANRHLKGLCEWDVPEGGLFCWMKVIGIQDTFKLIRERGVEKNIILCPGSPFSAHNRPSSYVRISFSIATKEEIERGMKNLAELIKEERNRQAA